MRYGRKIVVFAALIALFYCVSIIESTYAKYLTTAVGTANMTFARWNILVNSQDVINNSNFSSTIQPDFTGTANIASGVIAPTAQGSFDIELDMTEVDVSLDYTVSAALSSSNTVTDLRILSYTIDNVTTQYNGSFTNRLLVNAVNRTVTITFNVEWVEDLQDGAIMNNAADTAAATNGVAAIDVSVNFVQVR
ncbi:MAG: hypothetical protein IKR74_03155 [Bacilli bacterium]|nr:hypothetical protein [Bacilli bacterium]